MTDRPWGLTLATLGIQGFTGLLTMSADGKEYSISFDLGRIAAATSPLASDAAVRLALTNHLISSSQAAELNRQIVAAPDRDELEVLAELAGLTREHITKLRHRLAAQRSARTFSLDSGTYVADERIAMPPGAELDVREVVYLGARMNLSEQRLAIALRTFGSRFTITPDALPSLELFGFGSEERPVIQSLCDGTSLPQLEAAHRDVDPRMVQAIVYALVSAGACDIERADTAAGGVVEYESGPGATASRTATPPQGATYFVSRTATQPAVRAPTHPGEPEDVVELPSPTEIPNPPRQPRAAPELGSTARAPSRPVDEGVARIAPSASRTKTGQAPGQPPGSRTQTSDPATSRTQTSEPALSRTETGEPIVSLPPSSDPTGFRDDVAVPRTATPRPGAPSPGVRVPGQPTIPKGTRARGPDDPSGPNTGGYAAEGYASARTRTGPVGERTGPIIERNTAGSNDERTGAGSPTARTSTGSIIERNSSGSSGEPNSAGSSGERTGPATGRTQTSDPAVARTQSDRPLADRTQTSDPAVARTASGRPLAGRTQTSDPAVARTQSGRPVGPAISRTSTARRTQALIAARMILVEQGADYFTLIGVPFDASIDVVQTTYLNLARQLHPDKLDELGVPDLSGNAYRVFQQIGLAFSVLTDPARRAAYLEKLGRPAGVFVETTARTRTADDIPATPAGDAYRRGESALRRDEPAEAVVELGRACALEPNNVDFHAMLGWAQFCAARDKVTIAPETRKALERAVQRSAKPTQARFLLGRVERMLGRDREALRHFQEVVETSAQHADAAAEIRAIEARLAKSTGKR